MKQQQEFQIDLRREYLDHQDDVNIVKESGEGLTKEVIEMISNDKNGQGINSECVVTPEEFVKILNAL